MSEENLESTKQEPNKKSATTQGPMSKVLGYGGFGVGMILMIAFIPVSKSQTVNFIVGAVAGALGGGLGSWLGSLLDKHGKT